MCLNAHAQWMNYDTFKKKKKVCRVYLLEQTNFTVDALKNYKNMKDFIDKILPACGQATKSDQQEQLQQIASSNQHPSPCRPPCKQHHKKTNKYKDL